jgi:hypothetical protein
MVLVGAGILALVLAATGSVAALAGRSSPAAKAYELSRPAITLATTAAPHRSLPAPAAPIPARTPTGVPVTSPPPPPVLADGTYPTYIRGIDVGGATITVDVIQVFQDEAAVSAAIEDGKPRSEARYLYLYIRNQNPRLRTLPVVLDVRIQFLGECESPPDRDAALRELVKKTTPFDPTYYYDITVNDGDIRYIAQRLATPAC